MKKILTLLILTISLTSFAQTKDSLVVKEKAKVCGYLALGLSITNSSDFLNSNYLSLEGGATYKDFGAALVVGRGNLEGMFSKTDKIENYYLEGKVFYGFPIKMITLTPFIGYGGYINTKHMFIEYGAGISYTYKSVGFGLSYSNWDGVNYITPCVSYNF